MRLIVRGYADGVKILEEQVETDLTNLDSLVEKHTWRLIQFENHMMELEFPDHPDINQRFFRFGTDPGSMVNPAVIDLPSRVDPKKIN